MIRERIHKVWLDDTRVYLETESGRRASTPISNWRNLAKGTDVQRQHFYLSYTGIHWPDLDEDLGFEGIFAEAGLGSYTPSEDSFYYDPNNND